MKIHTLILVPYFLVIFPAVHLFYSTNKWVIDFWHIPYFAIALISVVACKQVTLTQLGFNKQSIGKPLLIGSLLSILLILLIMLLDRLLLKTGLSETDLLKGAELRDPKEMGFYLSQSGIIFNTLVTPFIEQLFITGYVINNTLQKGNAGRFILAGGLIYSILNFNLSIGSLILGMISVALLRTTGSIITPVLVNMGFAIAEILIVLNHPRLISALVFLI